MINNKITIKNHSPDVIPIMIFKTLRFLALKKHHMYATQSPLVVEKLPDGAAGPRRKGFVWSQLHP